MSDRGMKKWAPYASLIEQSICLEEMRYQKNKIDKPKISSERAEKINAILANYHQEEIILTYYYDGYLYDLKAIIKRIDANNRYLVFDDFKIPFSEIIDLKYASQKDEFFD